MNKTRQISLFIADILFILAGVMIDQLTKNRAAFWLKGQEPIVLIPGVLELKYLENRGAAFGLLQGGRIFFLIITSIVLIGILYILYRMPDLKKYRILRVLLVCVAAGAVGNMIDRALYGYVVDFIYIKCIDFPIFNVSDMLVTIPCILGAILLLFGKNYREEDFSFLKHRDSSGGEEKEPVSSIEGRNNDPCDSPEPGSASHQQES